MQIVEIITNQNLLLKGGHNNPSTHTQTHALCHNNYKFPGQRQPQGVRRKGGRVSPCQDINQQPL